VILGVELMALHLPGRCSTTWAMPPALFAFSYFGDRVWSVWTMILLFCWGDRCMPPHLIIGWDGDLNFLSRLTSNCSPPHLLLLSSWDYSCESQCPAHPCFLLSLLDVEKVRGEGS
jgi:hypothetical protein